MNGQKSAPTFSDALKVGALTTMIASAALLVLLVSLRPATVNLSSSGLDPSWVAASAYAVTHGFTFGERIVFTTGPYASVYTRAFVGDFTIAVVGFVLAIAVFLAWSMALALQAVTRVARSIVFSVIFLIVTLHVLKNASVDSLFLFVPASTAVIATRFQSQRPLILVGVVLSAVLGLTKFSVYSFAIASFILVDILMIYRKIWPNLTFTYLASSIALFQMAGQDWTNYISFVAAGLEFSAGYSAAMAVDGNLTELVMWLVMAGSLLLTLIVVEIGGAKRAKAWAPGITRMLLFAGLLFTGMKAGFVRHDGHHAMIAWSLLGLTAVAFCAPTIGEPGSRWKIAVFGMVAFVSVLPGALFGYVDARRLFDPVATARSLAGQISELSALAVDPRTWLDERSADEDARRRALAEQAALPKLDGSVDIIPSRQSDVIASAMDYHPRPSIQEYATYTRGLINRNRAHFESENPPDYLLFTPGSIDNRHPASAEGALWPVFLSRYESAKIERGLLVLKKREFPIRNLLSKPIVADVSMDQSFTLAQRDDALFVKLDVSENFFGRVLTFFLKPPQLYLVVQYVDETEDRYRLIPAMAREGMILSPTIRSAEDYWLMEAGAAAFEFVRRPVSFRIETSAVGRLVHRDQISVEVSEVDHSILAINATEATLAHDALGRFKGLQEIARKNGIRPPYVDMTPDGLFAHAPVTLLVETGSSTFLELQFGMKNGDYHGFPASDGVCFSAYAVGLNETLFQKCLDPKSRWTDLDIQTVKLSVPTSTTIELRTTCRTNCANDWSYWGRIDLSQPH